MIGSRIEKCRSCGNQELVSIYDMGNMALTGIFPGKDEYHVPEGPLELVKCHGDRDRTCGLVQLKHSFDPRILFGGSYGYRSGLNESMRRHLEEIAGMVTNFLTLEKGDTVIDVGSNDGTLLNFFSGKDLFLAGIDPTAARFKRYYSDDIMVVPDLFSGALIKKTLGTKKAKVITAIAVFYDIESPKDFLEEVRAALCDDGICVLEQSYLPLVLENLAYDTVCHEHAAYYRLKQIKWLADRTGLKIVNCDHNQVNGGSFCVVLAHKNSLYAEDLGAIRRFMDREERMSLDTLPPYNKFGESIMKHRETLRRTIHELRRDGRNIFGYGASTKGNVLLQYCGLTSSEIPFVADINDDKWGRVCPGTRIPIISEEDARHRKPDVFFVLPWHFKEGFLVKEKEYLREGGMFLFPLPEIDIIRSRRQGRPQN